MSDPWAAALAGEEGARLASELDAVFAHMELWTAVRTAYIDAKVARYTSPPSSFRQVVLLGAGLDTRAARLAKAGVRFFEVDHPDTQADKRRRLAALPGYPIDAASFIECDFEADDLMERLAAGGVDASAPALILWEGVVPYLREAAVRATLRTIAGRLHPRSVVVFDHLLKKQADATAAKNAPAQGFVGDLGEPILFGTNDPLPMLFEEGFRHVRSVSFDDACLTLTGTYLRERQFRFQRMVTASVTPP
jgi:methyltransferase (TIGR00027 family)